MTEILLNITQKQIAALVVFAAVKALFNVLF